MEIKRHLTIPEQITCLWFSVDENQRYKYCYLNINLNMPSEILEELRKLTQATASKLLVSQVLANGVHLQTLSNPNTYYLLLVNPQSVPNIGYLPIFDLHQFEAQEDRIFTGLFYSKNNQLDLAMYYDIMQQPYQTEDKRFFNYLFDYLDKHIELMPEEFEVIPDNKTPSFGLLFNKPDYIVKID